MSENTVKRGRPANASLPQKILEGLASDSGWKCDICHRVFPRNKSLVTHYKCHTGQTPYACDFPACKKSFRQSGHLRSHILTHTGEKPFKCPIYNCGERFIHANRVCKYHKNLKLIRDGNESIDVNGKDFTEDQRQWLQRYWNKKYNQRGRKRCTESIAGNSDDSGNSDEENIPVNNKRIKIDGYNSTGSESPSSSESHIYKNEVYSSAGSESPSPFKSHVFKNKEYNYSKPVSLSFASFLELDEKDIAAAQILVWMKCQQFK